MKKLGIRKAIFPVAGIGTRFLPVTKAIPKEMLPIVNKPLIQYAVEEAIASGVTDLIFITNTGKRAFEDHFDADVALEAHLRDTGQQALLDVVKNILPNGVNCIYLRQPQPLGLGHAVLCAKNIIGKEPFAVLLADDLIDNPERYCLQHMLDIHKATGSNVIVTEEMNKSQVDQYGIVELDQEAGGIAQAKQIIEKPNPGQIDSTLAVIGRYILMPSIFKHLENTLPGANGEIQLTDAIAAQLHEDPVYVHQLIGTRYDCGNKLGYLQATVQYGLKHPKYGPSLLRYLQQTLRSHQSDEPTPVAVSVEKDSCMVE